MIHTLDETKELMTSSNYKDRFKAEYYQLSIRINRLYTALQDDTIGLPSSKSILKDQLDAMKLYHVILVERAKIEHIEL